MKTHRRIFAALGFASVLPAASEAAQTDPEVIIYRFPGVQDSGGAAKTGVATSILCTNFSGQLETIRYVVRNFDSRLAVNMTLPINHLNTRTVTTHETALYVEDLGLSSGFIDQGSIAIAATSISIVCTASIVDASATVPVGIALHGVRFSPIPGSEE